MSFVHAGGYQRFETSGLPAILVGNCGYGKSRSAKLGGISLGGMRIMLTDLGRVALGGMWILMADLAWIWMSWVNVMRVGMLRVEQRVERPGRWSMGSGSLAVVERRRRVWLVWINELRVGGIGVLGFCSGVSVLALRIYGQESMRGIYLTGKVMRCG